MLVFVFFDFGLDEVLEGVSAVGADGLGVSFASVDFSLPAEDGGFEEDLEEAVFGGVVTEVAEGVGSGFGGVVVARSGADEFSEAGSAELVGGADVASDSSASSSVSGFLASGGVGSFDGVAADAIGLRRHVPM